MQSVQQIIKWYHGLSAARSPKSGMSICSCTFWALSTLEYYPDDLKHEETEEEQWAELRMPSITNQLSYLTSSGAEWIREVCIVL